MVAGGALVAGDELDRALARDEVVVEHAAEGNHGEAAVLELGQLAAGEAGRVLGLPRRGRETGSQPSARAHTIAAATGSIELDTY